MLNKIMLIGHVGQEPEIRYTQDGKPIANLSLATTEKWKSKGGEAQEKTEWHRIVVFGGLAGVVEKYVKKGDKLYIEGKIQTRNWTDNEGVKRYSTEVAVDIKGTLLMLGGKSEPKTQPKKRSRAGTVEEEGTPFDDKIPF